MKRYCFVYNEKLRFRKKKLNAAKNEKRKNAKIKSLEYG